MGIGVLKSIKLEPEMQSVALAGTFVDVAVSVDVDEAAIQAAGYVGVLSALPIAVNIVSSTGTVERTIALTRVGNGVWAGQIPAPTVAGGATGRAVVVAALSANVNNGLGVPIATPASIMGMSTPARWIRAAA